MFIQCLIISLLIILTYIFTKYYLIKTHKLFITPSKVKYKMNKRDGEYLKKYSKPEILTPSSVGIFYTDEKWSTKNNNYIEFEENYYIIEPGYYYNINEKVKVFKENKKIFKLNLK